MENREGIEEVFWKWIFFMDYKKNGEGKGERYLQKENDTLLNSSFSHQYLWISILTFISPYQTFLCNRTLFSGRENILCGGEEDWKRKRRNILREGKYLVSRGEEKRRRKGRKIFGEGEGIRKKYLVKKNIWSAKEKKKRGKYFLLRRRRTEKEMEGNILEKEKLLWERK